MPVRLPFPVIYIANGNVTAVEIYSRGTCTRLPHIEVNRQTPGEWLASEDVGEDTNMYFIVMHDGKVTEVWLCPPGGYWDLDLAPDDYKVIYNS